MAITIPETEPLEFYSGETVNFNDVIIGQWGGTDVLVDPYTGSGSGTIRVVVFADVDVAVRHAECFSATQDYLTT